MTIKCDSLQKMALFVLDILILICLLGLIACCCIFLKSEKNKLCSDSFLSIIFFSLSFLLFFIFFIINIKKDYLDNNGCRTVFRFISYGFTLYGFIIKFPKQSTTNSFFDIFIILGILVMIFLFISFLIGFFILNPETDIENMEKSQMSTFIPLIMNSKEE